MKQDGHARSKLLRPPSRGGPKMVTVEDSSGSEAGSEVSPEHETDRFGFIVSSGAEARIVGPHPQLVRQREAKWINIMDQWQSILLKKTNMVKVQCQKGIPTSLRAKCWPLLCGATNRMNHNKQLFQSLDSKAALKKWVDIIDRDLDRQFPFHEMFLSKDGHGQQGLFQVLKAYTQYQPEEGYCQAQGPVAAVLLMNMPAEEAFWCLVQISEHYLPGYYSPLLEGVLFDATMLTWVLKKTCPSAHKHLQRHEVEPLMFATDWLMCLFTRHLPFNALLRVWDLFFCNGVQVLLQVAVVLVRHVLGRDEQRKQCQGQMETLQRLRDVRCEVQKEDEDFIAEVCAVPLSSSDLEKQTEKALAKWRKDRPSSTFDPRGRCHGYRVAWERAQLNLAELDRKERETGNLSVPLARSASCLSLSPSLLHKRWRKGGNIRVQKASGGVSRHRSMGGKDWRSSNELNLQEKREDNSNKQQRGVSDEKKQTSVPREITQTPVGQHIRLTEHDAHQDLEEELLSDYRDIEVARSPLETDQGEPIALNKDDIKSESAAKNVAKRDKTEAVSTSEHQTRSKLDQDTSSEAVKLLGTDWSLSLGDTSGAKYHRTESLTEMNPEPQIETQIHILAQTQEDEVGEHKTTQHHLDDIRKYDKLCYTNTTCKSSLQCIHQVRRRSEACCLCYETQNNTTEQKQTDKEIIPSLKQVSVNRTPRFFDDAWLPKSSSSKLTRRLAQDLFTHPGQSVRDTHSPNPTTHQTVAAQHGPLEPAKHFSLFRRQPKMNTEKRAAKIQVPTILIQDFSEGTGKIVEETASSRESRRWWQREREMRAKEEERLRRKREKEVKKDGERRKPQTRGKGFQVQGDTLECSSCYAEAYF
ncbi:TBC1 domain family member 10B isoform X1 [Phyllopteryx taeniolatus]|uniref:TBC1 domain family member 10B isoform X1 n=1 Tax=Phyllopteryx taeniolatus TaxID=161469 RepID=UPI002AD1D5F4|nr:TBC1 domain family member 10B isoform X1 [Phyllopteryx taeniolatus]